MPRAASAPRASTAPRVDGARRARARARATSTSTPPRDAAAWTAREGVAALARAACGVAACGVVAATCAPSTRAAFYIEDVPDGLRASESASTTRRSLRALTSGPNGKAVEKCANKCLATCARGGGGGPGLGPASVRRDPIVFKGGFRSREYCLFECAETCARCARRAATMNRASIASGARRSRTTM